MDAFSSERERMVAEQIERRGIRSERVLNALCSLPRHRFVPPELRMYAYDDDPLPIGFEQTISQPYIVALMSELLTLNGDETVLEIGTGSGYQAAVLSRLAGQVHSVEIIPELARRSAALLADLGCTNVQVHCADGSLGWPAAAPYPAIIVTAAPHNLPAPLLEQLAPGGRLVIPVGARWAQVLQLWQKTAAGLQSQDITPVAFVPLVNG